MSDEQGAPTGKADEPRPRDWRDLPYATRPPLDVTKDRRDVKYHVDPIPPGQYQGSKEAANKVKASFLVLFFLLLILSLVVGARTRADTAKRTKIEKCVAEKQSQEMKERYDKIWPGHEESDPLGLNSDDDDDDDDSLLPKDWTQECTP